MYRRNRREQGTTAMTPQFCAACGTRLVEGAAFCAGCGARVGGESAPPAASGDTPPPAPPAYAAPAAHAWRDPSAARATALPDSRTLAFIGAGLLALGCFLPLFTIPVAGSITYFSGGGGDGIFILVFAAATVLLAILGKTRLVVFPGLLSLALMAFTYFSLQSRMGEVRATMRDNPFAEAAMGSVGLSWGWIPLLVGAAVTIYAGASAWRATRLGTASPSL